MKIEAYLIAVVSLFPFGTDFSATDIKSGAGTHIDQSTKDVDPDIIRALKERHIPAIDWDNERLADALEFLRLKVEAVRIQGLGIPPIIYDVSKDDVRRISYQGHDVTFWNILEVIKKLAEVEITISNSAIRIKAEK